MKRSEVTAIQLVFNSRSRRGVYIYRNRAGQETLSRKFYRPRVGCVLELAVIAGTEGGRVIPLTSGWYWIRE